MNYFLVLHNHPPIVIYQEDRKDYYASLEAWDTKQELAQLCDFLKEQTVKTWKKQIERSEKEKPEHDDKSFLNYHLNGYEI